MRTTDNLLAQLLPDDLQFLLAHGSLSASTSALKQINANTPPEPAPANPGGTKKQRRSRKKTPADANSDAATEEINMPTRSPDPLADQAHPLPAFSLQQAAHQRVAEDHNSARHRQSIAHVWPPTGTLLKADYYGTTYTAEVVTASKRLKSGRQLRLLDGPAKGRVFDSMSEAMLAATEQQRQKQNLHRSGVSNGWRFWTWPGKERVSATKDAVTTTHH